MLLFNSKLEHIVKKKKTHRTRDQICDYQRLTGRGDEKNLIQRYKEKAVPGV